MSGEPKKPSLRALATRSFKWAGLLTASTLLITLVRLVLLSRLLSPADFGAFAVGSTLIMFLAGIVHGMFGASLIQRRQDSEEPGAVASAFCASLVIGTTMALIVWALAGLLGAAYRLDGGEQIFRWVAPALVLRCAAHVPFAVIQREHDFRSELLASACSMIAGTVVSVWAAISGLGVFSLVAGLWAETAVMAAGAIVASRPFLAGRPRFAPAAALVRNFGGAYSLTFVSQNLNQSLQCFLVSVFFGATSLGFFTRTQALFESFAGGLFGPFVNRLFRLFPIIQQDPGKMNRAFRLCIEAVALFTFPLSAMLVISADTIVSWILGPRWVEASALFAVFCIGLTPRLAYKVSEFTSYALNRVHLTGRRAVLNIFITAALLSASAAYGLDAAVVAMLAATTINYVLSAVIAYRGVGVSGLKFLSLHARGATLAALVIGVSYLVGATAAPRLSSTASDLLACGASALLIAGLVVAFPRLVLGPELVAVLPRSLLRRGS